MEVEPLIYVNKDLQEVLLEEHNSSDSSSLKQLAEIATLPGVKAVCALPDFHLGYGFPIGSVSAFDIQEGIVSPGGVGYDINCGVRSYATNLTKNDISQQELADLLYDLIPSGIGSNSQYTTSKTSNKNLNKILDVKLNDLNSILDNGLKHLVDNKVISADELDFVEDRGMMKGDSYLISQKAKGRGLQQFGSLGSGNHYLEIQIVEEIYDKEIANAMNIYEIGQLIITIHCGSRGLGHKVCDDYLQIINKLKGVEDDKAFIEIESQIGKEYLLAMGSAANFAYCNRSVIGQIAIEAIKTLKKDVKINLIYDVCHNIAKKESHIINNKSVEVLVHRKGASRSFPPGHKDLPEKYKNIGQPVFVGGSMGTNSYILTGDVLSPTKSLGTACHGAGRIIPRGNCKKHFTYEEIMQDLKDKNILVKCRSEKGIVEEAPGCYKNVDVVVNVCEKEKIAKKIIKVKPFIVVKG
ncbi:hypothetical protein COBT_001634 [Conglomerata obtusa]